MLSPDQSDNRTLEVALHFSDKRRRGVASLTSHQSLITGHRLSSHSSLARPVRPAGGPLPFAHLYFSCTFLNSSTCPCSVLWDSIFASTSRA